MCYNTASYALVPWPRGMWNLCSSMRIDPIPSALEGEVSTTGPPGKFHPRVSWQQDHGWVLRVSDPFSVVQALFICQRKLCNLGYCRPGNPAYLHSWSDDSSHVNMQTLILYQIGAVLTHLSKTGISYWLLNFFFSHFKVYLVLMTLLSGSIYHWFHWMIISKHNKLDGFSGISLLTLLVSLFHSGTCENTFENISAMSFENQWIIFRK